MTTTRETARRKISGEAGYHLATTTTNITTDEIIIDTKLENHFVEDGDLNNCSIWLNSTANANVERTVDIHTARNGKLVLRGAALSTESESQEVEIHKYFTPTNIHSAINNAKDEQYQYVWDSVVDTTLFTRKNQVDYDVPSTINDVFRIQIEAQLQPNFDENILYTEDASVDFEDWTESTYPDGSATPTNLTCTKYGVTSQQDEWVPARYGNYVMKMLSSGSAGNITWTMDNYAYYAGQEVVASVPIYCLTGDEFTVKVSDGVGSSSSSAHGGTGMELVEVTHSMDDSASEFVVSIESAGNTIVGFAMQIIVSRAERYLRKVWKVLDNWAIYDDLIRFDSQLADGLFLRLSGKTTFSDMSADTSTFTLDEPEIRIIYWAAIEKLYEQLAAGSPDDSPWERKAIKAGFKLKGMQKAYRMKLPPIRTRRQM